MGDLLSPEELADYLKVPLATIYSWRSRGVGPLALKIGRHVRYRVDDVQEWLDEHVEAERGVPA